MSYRNRARNGHLTPPAAKEIPDNHGQRLSIGRGFSHSPADSGRGESISPKDLGNGCNRSPADGGYDGSPSHPVSKHPYNKSPLIPPQPFTACSPTKSSIRNPTPQKPSFMSSKPALYWDYPNEEMMIAIKGYLDRLIDSAELTDAMKSDAEFKKSTAASPSPRCLSFLCVDDNTYFTISGNWFPHKLRYRGLVHALRTVAVQLAEDGHKVYFCEPAGNERNVQAMSEHLAEAKYSRDSKAECSKSCTEKTLTDLLAKLIVHGEKNPQNIATLNVQLCYHYHDEKSIVHSRPNQYRQKFDGTDRTKKITTPRKDIWQVIPPCLNCRRNKPHLNNYLDKVYGQRGSQEKVIISPPKPPRPDGAPIDERSYKNRKLIFASLASKEMSSGNSGGRTGICTPHNAYHGRPRLSDRGRTSFQNARSGSHMSRDRDYRSDFHSFDSSKRSGEKRTHSERGHDER